jgi:hypothetical protein
MNGGEISGNSASYSSSSGGGGVYVYSNGTFIKQTGGVIYGSNASNVLKNTASGGGYGHAVYISSSPAKHAIPRLDGALPWTARKAAPQAAGNSDS